MALLIEDGYTLPFATEPTLTNGAGVVVYAGLPVVKGLYRPPTFGERQRHLSALQRAKDGDDEARVYAEFIASRLVSWDVQTKTPTGNALAPIDAEFIVKMPEPIVNQLYDRVTKWGAKSQGEQAGN